MSVVEVQDYTDAELAELNREFEHLPASKIIQWAVDSFAPHLSLSASMNDAVLIDLATKVHPAIEVVFIDTGYHFPETLETVEMVRRRYGLNLRMMTVPHHDEELWRVDPENCCSAVKVGQLDRALEGKAAWMSGLRREVLDGHRLVQLQDRELVVDRAIVGDRQLVHAGVERGQVLELVVDGRHRDRFDLLGSVATIATIVTSGVIVVAARRERQQRDDRQPRAQPSVVPPHRRPFP